MGLFSQPPSGFTSFVPGTHEVDPNKDGKKPLPVHIGKNKATCVFNDSISYQQGQFKARSEKNQHYTFPLHPEKFHIQSTEIYAGSPKSMPYEEKLLMRIKKGSDGRVRVQNTTTWPYVIHAQLEMCYASGNYGGSGILVGPHHILTAAHNVYSHNTQEWAQDISVCLGLNEKAAPFGTLKAVKAHTFNRWINERSRSFDIALLVLDRAIGSEVGWSGLLSSDDETLLKEEVNVTGYPGDKGFTKMMTMSNKLKIVEPEQFYYDIDTYGGQSGSGIWIDKWGSPYTIGIHTLGEGFLNTGNSGVRLSQYKFERIVRWISKSLFQQKKIPEPLSSAFTQLSITQPSVPQQSPKVGQLTASKPKESPAKAAIPEVAHGYEAIYERFINGVLIYKPNKDSDVGKIEMRIADLANPLEGTFDLSKCGDTDKYLSISTGYRRVIKPENARKIEIWLSPRFLIEKNIEGSASHFKPIMEFWDPITAPVGTFFTWGGWEDLSAYEYAITMNWEAYNNNRNNLHFITRQHTRGVNMTRPFLSIFTPRDQAIMTDHKLRRTPGTEHQSIPSASYFSFHFSSAFSQLSIIQPSVPQQASYALEPKLGQLTGSKPKENPGKAPIPEVARGYEAIYERFLKGKLIYQPNKDSDVGKIEMRIADLANPLEGTFDLSKCGDADKYLSISTGYRRVIKPENARKVEVWLSPRFLVEKNIESSASHFKPIMGEWESIATPVGTFFTWGDWEDLSWYQYVIAMNWEAYNADDLRNISEWKKGSWRAHNFPSGCPPPDDKIDRTIFLGC